MLSLGTAKLTQAASNSTSANKIATQAQSYASSKAEIFKAINYSNLTGQGKRAIPNSGDFYDEVTIGNETTYSSSPLIKQKECLVRVFKGTEALPRASLRFTRYSVSSDITSVPKGSILPWYGNLSNIPSGFALCNGQNGTPDLRNRFLVGAGSSYNLGATGGADWVTLTASQMPSHAHNRGNMEITGTFSLNGTEGSVGGDRTEYTGAFFQAGTMTATHNGHLNGGWTMQNTGFKASRSWTGVTSYEGGNQAHENRPPYYALYYIMKL